LIEFIRLATVDVKGMVNNDNGLSPSVALASGLAQRQRDQLLT